jgi:lysophospholipid acyltransferase (LPLAT)-like uncharacterized protein
VKKLMRSNAVQGLLGWLVYVYMALVLHTIRWTRINEAPVKAIMDTGSPAIGCFWHGTIALAIAAKPVVLRRKTRILISLSPDGEFVSRAIGRHGMPSIRGSSSKKDKGGKGALAAFREALDWLSGKGVLVITPDGPRGPNRVMQAGAVRIARKSGAPVFLFGLAAAPAKRLSSWDSTILPRPFGRGAIVWDGPLYPPKDQDDATVAAAWSARLTAACDRAEAEIAS